MDWDAWLRLSQRTGKFIYLKQKLMLHRIHRDSQTMLQIKKKVRQKEDEIIFERLWPKPLAKYLSKIYSFGLKLYNA